MIHVQQFRAHGVKLLYISTRRQKGTKFKNKEATPTNDSN